MSVPSRRPAAPTVVALALPVAGLFCAGCPPTVEEPVCLGPRSAEVEGAMQPAKSSGVHLMAIVAHRLNGAVEVVGASGSVPPSSLVQVESGAPMADDTMAADGFTGAALADEDGAFDLVVEDPDAQVTSVTLQVVLPDAAVVGPWPFRVRLVGVQSACGGADPIATGTLPNDVASVRCAERRLAAVPASGDGAVDALFLDANAVDDGAGGGNASEGGTRPAETAFFPPLDGEVASAPWGVAGIGAAAGADNPSGLVAVTLRGASTVGLVDACTGAILDEKPPRTVNGQPFLVYLDEEVELREPRDVDNDGQIDTVTTAMAPTAPQAVMEIAGRIYVVFTNVLQPALDEDRPMAAGPSTLVVFDVEGNELVWAGHRTFDCFNAQAIAWDESEPNRAWLSCTGLYQVDGGSLAATNGALVEVDLAELRARRTIPMASFGPATPALVDGVVVVGSTLRGKVAILDATAASIADADVLDLLPAGAQDRLQTVFEVVRVPSGGGLVLAAHFEADRLRVIDVGARLLDPPPFADGFGIGPGSTTGEIFRGLQAIDLDDSGRGAALLGLSAEVVPLDLGEVTGP